MGSPEAPWGHKHDQSNDGRGTCPAMRSSIRLRRYLNEWAGSSLMGPKIAKKRRSDDHAFMIIGGT